MDAALRIGATVALTSLRFRNYYPRPRAVWSRDYVLAAGSAPDGRPASLSPSCGSISGRAMDRPAFPGSDTLKSSGPCTSIMRSSSVLRADSRSIRSLICQMTCSNPGHRFIGLVRIVAQHQEIPDRSLGEAEFPAVANEGKARDVLGAVESLVAR